MRAPYPLTLLCDPACPVCALEMDPLRRKISRVAAPLIDAIARHRARRLARRMALCRGGACAVAGKAHAGRTTKEGTS